MLSRGLLTTRALGRAAVCALTLVLVACGAKGTAPSAAALRDPETLPDFTGVWVNYGGPENEDLFDGATSDPRGCRATSVPCRSHPPLTPAWEEKYAANLALARAGRLAPESTTCMPRGVPANMRTRDSIEFVVRPEQVWMFSENTHLPRRIYTDGRPHRSGPDAFLAYAGDSIGHWEGDVLIVETINLRQDKMIDRSGIFMSEKMKINERIRRVDADTLEDIFTIEDSEALTRPWVVKRLYRRVKDGRIFDYACAENVRNGVAEDGTTITFGSNGEVIGN
jgi:hypothetical protein